jgi:hypothetical protein
MTFHKGCIDKECELTQSIVHYKIKGIRVAVICGVVQPRDFLPMGRIHHGEIRIAWQFGLDLGKIHSLGEG